VGGRSPEDHPAGVFFRPERVEVLFRVHRDEVGEVRVRLDTSGHDDLPGGVDHARRLQPLLR